MHRYVHTFLFAVPAITISLPLTGGTALVGQGPGTLKPKTAAWLPYGPVTEIRNARVTVRRQSQAKSTVVTAVNSQFLHFTHTGGGEVVPGLMVERSVDGQRLRFSEFPITSEPIKSSVGNGGKFRINTYDLRLSLAGPDSKAILAGRTIVITDDKLQGFHGAVGIVLRDAAGNDVVAPFKVGCWGVQGPNDLRNERQWSLELDREIVGKVRSISAYHWHDKSCRGTFATLMKNLERTREIVAKVKEIKAEADQ
jgi:hypothetical protein